MSTRLILKNLPKNADEARVREHFKTLGDVTDVKVLRTKDGRSRCFGFIGFKDKQQAADARQYFDKSCMGRCRLEVSFAESYKAEKSSDEAAAGKEEQLANVEQENTKNTASKGNKREQLLQEFLGVNKHKSKQQMFANDEVNPEIAPTEAAAVQAVEAAEEDGSDATEHNLDEMSDMDYLRSRMGKLNSGAEVRNSAQDMPEASSPADSRHQGSDSLADAVALIGQTSKLFVRNLPFVTADDDLLALMKPYGDVEDVRVVRDKSTGASKGFALVQFKFAPDAVAAFQALDGEAFQGRLLHVIPGKAAEQAPIPEGTEPEVVKKAGFKAERDSKRKANAGDKTAWSTFFMREDTVASAVSDLLGITKAELLDPEAPDAAVRMALGEAQVIAATKKELAEAGVNIVALEKAARASGHASSDSVTRSSMVLLVKNLPSEATEDALEELFAKHGAVVRLLLPRTKALAIVEMSDEQGARRAFKRLAYKRFLHVPLYLEYAPKDVLEESLDQSNVGKAGKAKSVPLTDADLVATAAPAVTLDNPDSHVTTSTTLYLKNISFETSRAALEKHCKKAAKAVGGVLRSVAVPSKKVTSKKKPAGEDLLQGFAFAEFGDQKTAEAALKHLQGSALDGHKLQVEFSRTETGTSQKGAAKRDRDTSETKLMVRNLAFEATSKDVRQLMEAFGYVKTCRLPKKFDGTTRGFAFVEFATKGEAQRAMESTYGTHLYGRRMLLEYAKGEEGVSELRSKAQRVS